MNTTQEILELARKEIAKDIKEIKEITKKKEILSYFNFSNSKVADVASRMLAFHLEQLERDKFFFEELIKEIEKGGESNGSCN